MFYYIISKYLPQLEQTRFGFLRVFTFTTFQAMASIILSMLVCLMLGPRVIAWLRRTKIGDNPNFDQAKMNEMMKDKSGTPTMGGLLIIFSILASVLLLADVSNFYVRMGIVCLIWLGGVGAIDDWLKLTVARRQKGSRQGLTGLEKLLFQIGLAVILCWFCWNYGSQVVETHNLYVPFRKAPVLTLNFGTYLAFGVLVIVGSSNAVNLTDGLDGLASGCMALTAFAFLVLALIIGEGRLGDFLLFHHITPAAQMAVIAGAILGACVGFLWFNCAPARVFMGDTGSLALGGLIGYIAIVIRQELMLLIIGGVFVAEALSVMLQVGYFKYTRKRFGTGRRVFLMSPLHSHFRLKGWAETQVVIRFWLISAMLAIVALMTIKLR